MTQPGTYAQQARIHKTYNSFSGVDIQATFAGKPIGELQGVSYTVTREKAPLYTMGSPDPRAFSRGKRGIAGSLIFLVFDRSNLLTALEERAWFWADVADLTYLKNFSPDGKIPGQTGTPLRVPVSGITLPLSDSEEKRVGTVTPARAWYHDQLPPMDIVLTALNEYGHAARMAIRGVEILNAGSGISIDDITTDENMTFVATDIVPWTPLGWMDPVMAVMNAGATAQFSA